MHLSPLLGTLEVAMSWGTHLEVSRNTGLFIFINPFLLGEGTRMMVMSLAIKNSVLLGKDCISFFKIDFYKQICSSLNQSDFQKWENPPADNKQNKRGKYSSLLCQDIN